MSEADWEKVTVLRKTTKQLKKNETVNTVLRSGDFEVQKKFLAGTNKNVAPMPSKKIEEVDIAPIQKVPLSLGKIIQQSRQKLNLSQKELATFICEKPTVITDYESSKAIPDQRILAKLEQKLGVKLRGKNIGDPLK